MLSNTQFRAFRPVQKSKGYFLFELVLSALMIAAIVVLAFPTYQDFSPEHDVMGEISVLEQARQTPDARVTEDSASLAAEQQETKPVSSLDSDSEEENGTS